MIEYEHILAAVNVGRLDSELREAYGDKYGGLRTAPVGGRTHTITTTFTPPTFTEEPRYSKKLKKTVMERVIIPGVAVPSETINEEPDQSVRVIVELADDADTDLAALICASHDAAPDVDPDLEWLENYTPGKRGDDGTHVSVHDFQRLVDIVKRRCYVGR